MSTIVISISRSSSSETGGCDAEQELQQREADRGDRGRGGADRDGREPVRGVAQLADAAGAVADGGEHQRADAERLEQRDVDEQAEAEAEDGARDRAGDEAGGGHEQRREVGRDAEDGHLGDGAELRGSPPSRPISARRTTERGGDRHASLAAQVGVGLGQHLHHVHALQVGRRLDVDAAVELAVAEVDPRDACRSGSPAGSATPAG